MSMAERIFPIFVGLVLLVIGAGIVYAFHAFGWQKGHDIWDVGFFLVAEAYSIVGSLFLLLGLRYAFGRHRLISHLSLCRQQRHT